MFPVLFLTVSVLLFLDLFCRLVLLFHIHSSVCIYLFFLGIFLCFLCDLLVCCSCSIFDFHGILVSVLLCLFLMFWDLMFFSLFCLCILIVEMLFFYLDNFCV